MPSVSRQFLYQFYLGYEPDKRAGTVLKTDWTPILVVWGACPPCPAKSFYLSLSSMSRTLVSRTGKPGANPGGDTNFILNDS